MTAHDRVVKWCDLMERVFAAARRLDPVNAARIGMAFTMWARRKGMWQ